MEELGEKGMIHVLILAADRKGCYDGTWKVKVYGHSDGEITCLFMRALQLCSLAEADFFEITNTLSYRAAQVPFQELWRGRS